LIPDRDPVIADRDDHTADRLPATQPLPGTDLEPRREALPELAQPNRAASIVSEFVHSIVEEAQERAIQMIQAAADQNDAGQREALESADRMRAHIDEMAGELETAAGQLRTESERLAALRQLTTAASVTGGAAVDDDDGEQLALAQVSAGLEQEGAETPVEEREEDAHDVEVVSHGDEDELEEEHHEPVDAEAEEEPLVEHEEAEPVAAPEAEAEIETEVREPEPEPRPAAEDEYAESEAVEPEVAEPEPEPEPTPAAAGLHPMSVAGRTAEPVEPEVEEPEVEDEDDDEPEADAEQADEQSDEERELQEDHARFAAMPDGDLAIAYVGAVERLEAEPEDGRQSRLLRYAGAALGEALTRPAFADIGQGAPAPEPVPRFGRKRRQRAEAINALRRACAQAIEEIDSDDEPGTSEQPG
jgi:hypothetical protein